ncbi:outer-membrane lipoprotein carrier protein LolA [Pelagibacteraceae bacterium]|nr:outer-membrane lipoprotein carrier protein LolA [Pelagibacteraceae bacterium]
MLVKDMFSKNEKYLSYFYIIVFLILSFKVESNSNVKIKVLDYLNSLQYFSASFIQNDNKTLSEGRVYIGKKRVRAEYLMPSKILIILDEDKGMYYNFDLEEEEFFNPKNTNAWFFYDIFRNPYFFEDSRIVIKDKEIMLEKTGFDREDTKYLINVYFENSPVILRKIEVFINDELLQISIFDHNYNEDFDKSFFKLISPKLLN